MSPQALLDELQAAEAAGSEALTQWLSACRDPVLRGGLRVIAARDGAHARLARDRLSALGGATERAPSRQLQSLCSMLVASEVSDRSKLAMLLARFPAQDDDPLPHALPDLDDETRALVETIRDDDRASVRWLRDVEDALGRVTTAGGGAVRVDPATLRTLDAFRAAEHAGAEIARAWCAVCGAPGLRGGLRTFAEREATHAALLEARLPEVGWTPRAQVDDGVREAARDRFASSEVTDEEKLGFLVARHPGPETATPLHGVLEDLVGDPETREMLRLVLAGEAATFAWLRSYREAMHGRREPSRRMQGR